MILIFATKTLLCVFCLSLCVVCVCLSVSCVSVCVMCCVCYVLRVARCACCCVQPHRIHCSMSVPLASLHSLSSLLMKYSSLSHASQFMYSPACELHPKLCAAFLSRSLVAAEFKDSLRHAAINQTARRKNLLAERVNLGSASSWFQPRPVPHRRTPPPRSGIPRLANSWLFWWTSSLAGMLAASITGVVRSSSTTRRSRNPVLASTAWAQSL